MLVTEIIGRIRSLLQDTGTTQRWSNADLLACFNEAQLALVQNRPDSYSQVTDFACTDSARQTLPPGTYRLMDVIDNQDSGRSVVRTTRMSLDSLIPGWPRESGDDVEHFIYDEKSPTVFYIYPVPGADHSISILISRTPEQVAIADFDSSTEAMTLDVIWLNPLLNYMMFRAYMMDGETEGNLQQARTYISLFVQELGLKWNVDQMFRRMRQKALPDEG